MFELALVVMVLVSLLINYENQKRVGREVIRLEKEYQARFILLERALQTSFDRFSRSLEGHFQIKESLDALEKDLPLSTPAGGGRDPLHGTGGGRYAAGGTHGSGPTGRPEGGSPATGRSGGGYPVTGRPAGGPPAEPPVRPDRGPGSSPEPEADFPPGPGAGAGPAPGRGSGPEGGSRAHSSGARGVPPIVTVRTVTEEEVLKGLREAGFRSDCTSLFLGFLQENNLDFLWVSPHVAGPLASKEWSAADEGTAGCPLLIFPVSGSRRTAWLVPMPMSSLNGSLGEAYGLTTVQTAEPGTIVRLATVTGQSGDGDVWSLSVPGRWATFP
jgi:hypothetical protein